MKKIIVKVQCNIKGKEYIVGAEFKPKKNDIPLVNRLNEKGFIEPLTEQELIKISESFNKSKKKEMNDNEL